MQGVLLHWLLDCLSMPPHEMTLLTAQRGGTSLKCWRGYLGLEFLLNEGKLSVFIGLQMLSFKVGLLAVGSDLVLRGQLLKL